MKNKRNEDLNNLTKESISLAYYKLLLQKEDISIKKICEKAGVSRNAYYRNFESVDEIIIYYLILKWANYCENAGTETEISNDVGSHLIKYFYSEREFVRAIKQQGQIYLVEELFRKVLIPKDVSGAEKYFSYVVAYSIYSFIRAMIDNDFTETPDELNAMFKAYEKLKSKN
ncbi:TetR/AcrR family transcriptional regulator [Clostridium sp. P21]|uniref:TetR/AcrR family transcriptional regulator n=1 Tax=Clostridium muellerianum TaxID=2716538 RepID=A0A7Y0HQB6_9CLOT|nr:TetR/AcrR family transcriptional regulator [Clostridium muellerianum]NMM63603.1 TetR/AcrR family transcriptional regulator [Clostridium muellerianum]